MLDRNGYKNVEIAKDEVGEKQKEERREKRKERREVAELGDGSITGSRLDPNRK